MIDWTGNSKALFATLGASNHSNKQRANEDYYCTPPYAVEKLLSVETFNHNIWENACGEGHISKILESRGYDVYSTDIINRGYGNDFFDFLTYQPNNINTKDIITNPPYVQATAFVKHSLDISADNTKIAMLLKIQFLETKERYKLFKLYPPKKIYVFVERICCGKNGMIVKESSAVCYAWFIWEKGYQGLPQIDWLI